MTEQLAVNQQSAMKSACAQGDATRDFFQHDNIDSNWHSETELERLSRRNGSEEEQRAVEELYAKVGVPTLRPLGFAPRTIWFAVVAVITGFRASSRKTGRPAPLPVGLRDAVRDVAGAWFGRFGRMFRERIENRKDFVVGRRAVLVAVAAIANELLAITDGAERAERMHSRLAELERVDWRTATWVPAVMPRVRSIRESSRAVYMALTVPGAPGYSQVRTTEC